MSIFTTMHGEQLGSIANAAKTLLMAVKPPSRASARDVQAFQRLVNLLAQMGDNQAWDIACAWEDLAAGKIDDPRQTAEILLFIARQSLELLENVEDAAKELVCSGVARIEPGHVSRARRVLAAEAERMRSAWPMLTPQQLAELQTLRAVAGAAAAAEDETPLPGWTHLVSRKHPWRRQPYLAGRNLTVRHVAGHVAANGMSEDEAAADLGLPVEAVREALRYAEENGEVIDRDTACEQYILAKEGPRRGSLALPR
jgi:uncharacterized protein (DUF433 family)